jgi:hypothetical protein
MHRQPDRQQVLGIVEASAGKPSRAWPHASVDDNLLRRSAVHDAAEGPDLSAEGLKFVDRPLLQLRIGLETQMVLAIDEAPEGVNTREVWGRVLPQGTLLLGHACYAFGLEQDREDVPFS